ncbi:signal peptidase I [Halorubrum sp. RMP-47]|uniref:signal peptidase I n=1 Tax=Halorubrum miltondacostae TaxID=3076378 RepID=UPI003528918E
MTQLPRPSMRVTSTLLVTIVLVAAISPFAVFAVPQIIGADESYVVLSGSMEPVLSPGDVVIVDSSGPVQNGDVITYRSPGDSVPTTHRVVGEVDGRYETKGDANEEADTGTVAPEAIIGQVVLTLPLIGHIILWANTPVGYVLLVISPLVLLGLNELLVWARKEPDERTNKTGKHDKELASVSLDEDADAPSVLDDPDATDVDEADDWEFPAVADTSSEPESDNTVTIAAVDLKLTLLAMSALLTYAGWNIYQEFSLTAAPTPISVGAFTAGLLGLLFTGWVTLTTWQTARAARSKLEPEPEPTTAAPASAPTLADGSGEAEVNDE